ncbi:hypothetical protein OHA79_50640 (plasmid) [Streptomyces sp. NBC_00841]|uniref:hypothetical protein n=1 Tax=Streptomyces sp. NBC_00841 TaxID=2975847 RepID=UPI002DD79E45|nr:hypothetical protein [Streptomyces sp. NBC_00841]WSA05693.1 hypothetical protein OHA79_50640 [Streptomyces sp. NBC_00841]
MTSGPAVPPARWPLLLVLSHCQAHSRTLPSDAPHEVKRRAEADDRSVASWIRAVEHELNRTA